MHYFWLLSVAPVSSHSNWINLGWLTGFPKWLHISDNNLSSMVYTPSHNLITPEMATSCFQHIYNVFVRICHICRGLMNHRMSAFTTLSIRKHQSISDLMKQHMHSSMALIKLKGKKEREQGGGEWMLIPQPDEKDLESSSINPLLWGIDGKNNKERHWWETQTAMAIIKNC